MDAETRARFDQIKNTTFGVLANDRGEAPVVLVYDTDFSWLCDQFEAADTRIAELERQLAERGTFDWPAKQRELDIKNLRFYAEMFEQHRWGTIVVHWSVFNATLKEIAGRIEALQRPESVPVESAQPTPQVVIGPNCIETSAETAEQLRDATVTWNPSEPTPEPASRIGEPDEHPLDKSLGDIHEMAIALELMPGGHDWAVKLAAAHEKIQSYLVANDEPATDPPAASVGDAASRPETGPMRFENDWCGLFIRGDRAFGWAMYLESFVRNPQTSPYKKAVQGLVEFLRSCDEGEKPKAQSAKLEAALPVAAERGTSRG